MMIRLIKDAMKKHGISNKDLGIGTGISESTISRNLSGKTKMSVDNMEKILTFLESKKK